MKKTRVLFLALLIGSFALSFSASADTPHSPQDSLSADGPYILYRPGGVEVIEVDVLGNITRREWEQLPEDFRFRVTDHRGKYPFDVRLRPFSRAAWQQRDIPGRTFVMSDPHGRLDCVIDLLQGNQVRRT